MHSVLTTEHLVFIIALPILIYTLTIWWADRYEREPSFLIFIAFAWGAIPAVFLTLSFGFMDRPGTSEWGNLFTYYCVHAPLVEEFCKGLVLAWIFFANRQQFDGPLDGLVYGCIVGFGFSTTEDLLYLHRALAVDGIEVAQARTIVRSLFFAFQHSFFTSFLGLGFGLSVHAKTILTRCFFPFCGFFAAVFAHALNNFFAFLGVVASAGEDPLLGVLSFLFGLIFAFFGLSLTFLIIFLAWRKEKLLIRRELKDEINCLLTEDEFSHLCAHWFQPLTCYHPQTLRKKRLVQLALRKARKDRIPPSCRPSFLEGIEQLRRQLQREFKAAQS